MDAVYDLGGRQGFGRVRYAQKATAFHAPWEVRVNALYAQGVKAGIFNIEEYRHAIERMEPRHYLTASYYERSLTSLATLCVEKGVLTLEELERRAHGAVPLSRARARGARGVVSRWRSRARRDARMSRQASASSRGTACACKAKAPRGTFACR